MSFVQDDIDVIANALGVLDVEVIANSALEKEYMTRLRLYHRMGGVGQLTHAMLVDCLRFCGLEPPDARILHEAAAVNWNHVKLGTRVIVHPNTRHPDITAPLTGTYQGRMEPGVLMVCLDRDGDGWVSDHGESSVTLALPDAPIDLAPKTVLSSDPSPEAPDEVRAMDRPDSADLEGPVSQPKLQSSDLWLARLESGVDKVLYRRAKGSRPVLCEFMDTGPKNGQVTIIVEGRPCYVDASTCSPMPPDAAPIGRAEPATATPKRKRGRPKQKTAPAE